MAVVLGVLGASTANAQSPPIPQPGQTVHWTIADSPVVISTSLTIPGGGSVIVDPGVSVEIRGTNTRLTVQGRISFLEGTSLQLVNTQAKLLATGPSAEASFLGTEERPVHISGSEYVWYGVDAQQGAIVTLDHCQVSAMIHCGTFYSQPDAPTIAATNSTFAGGSQYERGVWAEFGTLVVKNCSFVDGARLMIEESYLLVDQLTLHTGVIDTYRRKAGQPIYFNNIEATGVAEDAPFVLEGFDHFFGASNDISGNRWPVHLTGGGIAPGSVLPLSGNQDNRINVDGNSTGVTTLAEIGLDYVSYVGGEVVGRTVEPGVRVFMGPEVLWEILYDVVLLGRHDAPIVFEPLSPGTPWESLYWNYVPETSIVDWCELRGANRAVHAFSSNVWLQNCLFEDNARGMYATHYGSVRPRKTRCFDNAAGIEDSPQGFYDADGTTTPNWFEGNVFGAKSPESSRAVNNYWGDPSGPQHPTNPAGRGDPISGPVQFQPFRTQEPDFTDRPPTVRVASHAETLEVGQVLIISWESNDNRQIVRHRIEHSPHDGCFPLSTFIDDIPKTARSWVVRIPEYLQSNCLEPAVFRVVAVDDAGQEGFDELKYFARNQDMPDGAMVPVPIGQTLRPGQEVSMCVTEQGAATIWGGGFNAVLYVDSDEQGFSLGGTTTDCLPLGLQAPPVSTDLARVAAIWTYGAGNRRSTSFSPYFEVRPDPEITGDLPPTIEMLTPLDGQSFAFGAKVTITWDASDDEAVRSFSIHASYDNGRTWNVIAKDLAADARTFDWRLPGSQETLPNVRVRVIVRDLRFQTTSDGAERAITLLPGQGSTLPDPNCDGVVSVTDIGAFVIALTNPTAYGAAFPACDLDTCDMNGDGEVSVGDIGPFVTLLTGNER